MTTTNNMTNTSTINIYNNTEQIINRNPVLLDKSSSKQFIYLLKFVVTVIQVNI